MEKPILKTIPFRAIIAAVAVLCSSAPSKAEDKKPAGDITFPLEAEGLLQHCPLQAGSKTPPSATLLQQMAGEFTESGNRIFKVMTPKELKGVKRGQAQSRLGKAEDKLRSEKLKALEDKIVESGSDIDLNDEAAVRSELQILLQQDAEVRSLLGELAVLVDHNGAVKEPDPYDEDTQTARVNFLIEYMRKEYGLACEPRFAERIVSSVRKQQGYEDEKTGVADDKTPVEIPETVTPYLIDTAPVAEDFVDFQTTRQRLGSHYFWEDPCWSRFDSSRSEAENCRRERAAEASRISSQRNERLSNNEVFRRARGAIECPPRYYDSLFDCNPNFIVHSPKFDDGIDATPVTLVLRLQRQTFQAVKKLETDAPAGLNTYRRYLRGLGGTRRGK